MTWDDYEAERRPGPADGVRRLWRRVVNPAKPTAGPRQPHGREPKRAGWTRVLGVGLAAFAIWTALDAPTLQHNAQVSPVGLRRTVSLDVLGPLAAFSRDLGLSHVVSYADHVIGRNGNRPGNGLLTSPFITMPAPKRGTKSTVTTTTTTLPMVTLNRFPSVKDPLRVLVVGDSLGIDLGDVLVNDLVSTGVVQATLDGEVSTGLTRPDYFNWPDELSVDLPKYTPQLIVIMIGANDPQDFPGPPDIPFGTSTWDTTYASRVAEFMAEAKSRGAQVIWVGMPPMQNPGLSAAMSRIDGIVQTQAGREGVDFLSSWTVLGTPTGQFTPYLVVGGEEVNVREPDGTHISPGGAQVLSAVAEAHIRSDLHIDVP